ncbi:MAG TPA: aldo/keto reductase [Candidatus Saccharimonadales bacterium]|nr:aldo/keto reductase [Candidatus Saccharimonadales bacterium]
MKAVELNNKQAIPAMGFGTWRLPNDDAASLVEEAINSGYRHIDCAMIYENEKEVGEGIGSAIAKGLVKREDLFVTSKLWNTDHATEHVTEACRKTLNDLKLDYLDLYLVHWGVSFVHGESLEPLDENGVAKFSPIPMQETWRAMEQLVEDGLVKAIGVANFTAPMLIDLLTYARIKPAINQIELHPFHAQDDLVKFCKSLGIAVTAYSPFGSAGAPVLNNPVLQAIAEKYSRTPAQVALRWALQRDTVVIPKSANPARIKENVKIDDFELSDEDMDTITSLDQRKIFVNPIEWWGLPYF